MTTASGRTSNGGRPTASSGRSRTSLNPAFASGGSVADLVAAGRLDPGCERIFRVGKDDPAHPEGRALDFHQHQAEAIDAAAGGHSYVLTTGTGSGKSLGYLVPIVDRVLRDRAAGRYERGVKAIVVYPMNALANSQLGELGKFLGDREQPGGRPVTFERYTGQESELDRRRIQRLGDRDLWRGLFGAPAGKPVQLCRRLGAAAEAARREPQLLPTQAASRAAARHLRGRVPVGWREPGRVGHRAGWWS